mmetsp:Transcript_9994/g.32114  ORF Transcript_9994/g.32114 Transcript_9994/m.32114 type:complete len:214 (-) Transcript_9994:327-968(-)
MSSLFSQQHLGGGEDEAAALEDEVKLFIGNLSWNVTSEELSEYLSQAGVVTSCEVKRNHNGQSKGFALASFADVEAAKEAIVRFNDVEMQGRRLIVRVDSPPEDRPARGRGRGRAESFSSPGRPRARSTDAPCERIFCGNLPFATSQHEFESLFADLGCTYAKIQTDDDGQSKGYGIVAFPDVDAAADAISKFNGFKLDGRPMRCKFDALPPK